MEQNGINLIKELLDKYNDDVSFEERVYCLIKKQGLNEIRLRNTLIIRDFDQAIKGQDRSYKAIHKELADKYCTSAHTIEKVIQLRAINQI